MDENRQDILFLTRKREHTPEEQERYRAYVHAFPITTWSIAQAVDLERDRDRWVRDWERALSTWNLKYDPFPSIETLSVYALENGFILGQEHTERLLDAMQKRADTFWGVQ